MAPSQKSKSTHPDAPTRLAKRSALADTIRQNVYPLDELDRFFTIHHQNTAEPYDWVAVGCPGAFTLELYTGQPYFAVVRFLDFYQLTQSQQWNPRIRNRFTNW